MDTMQCELMSEISIKKSIIEVAMEAAIHYEKQNNMYTCDNTTNVTCVYSEDDEEKE